MANSDLVQSLLRGLDLVELLAARPEGVHLNDLAEATGLKKPTVHNLLRTLCARNFAARDDSGRYVVGPALVAAADRARRSERDKRAETALLELADGFAGHVLTVATLTPTAVKCELRVSPDMPGTVQHPVGRDFAPYSSVSAIVLQAANPQEARRLETLYPFEEYGVGIWGDAAKFAAVRDRVLRDRCLMRERNGHVALAFVMPKCRSLGFSFHCADRVPLGPYRAAAAEFRRRIWGAGA